MSKRVPGPCDLKFVKPQGTGNSNFKSQGPGTANWGLAFSNEGGTIDVQEGTLNLGRGGNSLGGTIMVAPDATLNLTTGGVHNLAGSYGGTADGNVILNAQIDPSGATFNFEDFNWSDGTLRGPGTLTNNGMLSIVGSAPTMNDTAAIDNAGTINLSSTEFRGGQGAIITNMPGAAFVIEDDADANANFQAASSSISRTLIGPAES